MALETTYSNLRQNLSALLDQVCADAEPLIVRRKGRGDVALIPADELSSLIETAYLLKSPANAERLLTALRKADAGELPSSTTVDLARELGLGQED